MLCVPEGQGSLQQGRRGLVAGAGSWLITFLFTYRKRRERAGSGVRWKTLQAHSMWRISSTRLHNFSKQHHKQGTKCSKKGGTGDVSHWHHHKYNKPVRNTMYHKELFKRMPKNSGPSTHRDRDYSLGEDELQQHQFCFFCCRVWSSVKIPIREVGEGLLLNWKLSWWPYFRNVQMLDIHLVIYTLVVNCSETSGSVDKQRGWLWSFLPSVFTSRSQPSWIIRIQY